VKFRHEHEIGKNQFSRKARKGRQGKISKHEIRNSKQFLNDETQNEFNLPNRSDQNRRFEFSEFRIYLAAVCFGFSASDFGFS